MGKLASSRRAAVIDIGSNSVRLVIYSVRGAAALPHFNEKVMAGLGTDLAETGELWPDGVTAALAALRRYRAILDALGVEDRQVVATAAVREASDGAKFCKKAEKAGGVAVRVLSGADEAALSALGASSGLHEPRGIVGDLGGSSLELARVRKGKIQLGETHLLGPLSFGTGAVDDLPSLQKRIRKQLKSSACLTKSTPTFYAVGGAWRSLAQLHMSIRDYPLRALQGYRMSAKAVRQVVKAALSNDAIMQAHTTRISRRRAETLPHAAAVLGVLFEEAAFSELIVSSYGVREGALMDAYGDAARDALLDGVVEAVRLDMHQVAFGEELYEFVHPALQNDPDLFGERREEERVIKAACLYADSGARYHPDHRASQAYDHALRGPYAAASHAERAFLALAVAARYSRRFTRPEVDHVLLNEDQAIRAQRLGALMRLGCVLSGRSAPILADAKLKRTRQKLILSMSEDSEAMISATVRRRLAQAASDLSLEPEVVLKD